MGEPSPHPSTQTSNAGGSGAISQKSSTSAQPRSLCDSKGAMTQGWSETPSLPLLFTLAPLPSTVSRASDPLPRSGSPSPARRPPPAPIPVMAQQGQIEQPSPTAGPGLLLCHSPDKW